MEVAKERALCNMTHVDFDAAAFYLCVFEGEKLRYSL